MKLHFACQDKRQQSVERKRRISGGFLTLARLKKIWECGNKRAVCESGPHQWSCDRLLATPLISQTPLSLVLVKREFQGVGTGGQAAWSPARHAECSECRT